MKTTKTRNAVPWARSESRLSIVPATFSVLLSLGLSTVTLPAKGQQLDKPDTIQSFEVNSSPYGMAFDGENIWVTSAGSGSIDKLRASDGTLLGHFNVGSTVYATFDGTYIWISMYHKPEVERLRLAAAWNWSPAWANTRAPSSLMGQTSGSQLPGLTP